MIDNIYDIAIIGAGVAGAFAAYNIADYKNIKTCLIDFGRPPNKRRKQLEGWLGCFPNSNARLYCENNSKEIIYNSGLRNYKRAFDIVNPLFESNGPMIKSKNKLPNESVKKALKDHKYCMKLDNYAQWKPENIHALSRKLSRNIIDRDNLSLMFDCEVFDIEKDNDLFIIKTEIGIIKSKMVLLCAGRSGWRFSNNILTKFNVLDGDNYAYFGFRAEMPSSYLKEWNSSHCSFFRKDIFIGPMCWNGTVIPEDHCDFVISSWRSNEDRWETDKVSFSVMLKKEHKKLGAQQTERLAKLAFILSDNRVGKLRVKEFISAKNLDLFHIPEYDWFHNEMDEIERIIPGFLDKGNIYIPDIITHIKRIKKNKGLLTACRGLFVAGESAGISGIYGSALSGTIAILNIISRIEKSQNLEE